MTRAACFVTALSSSSWSAKRMADDGLTPEQRDAIQAFVNAHRAYEAHASKVQPRSQSLFDQRQAALLAASEVGLSAATIARESDLSAGRVSQLKAKLGLAKPRTPRTVGGVGR